MPSPAYLAGIAELYAAEVLGEALASRWLQLTTDPEQRYKLALFLQLESEAKVRLRPLLASLGLDLVEDEGLKTAAHEVAERFAAMGWQAAMAELSALAAPYRDRFQALLAVAEPAHAPMVLFMAAHEAAVVEWAGREATGAGSMVDALIPLLDHPLPRPLA
jgi:hypothetical protein